MATNRTVALSDEQARLLAACQDLAANGTRSSLRSIAEKHNVPRTTLKRHSSGPATVAGILERTFRRGSRQQLSTDEESIIAETVVEFQNHGTPLVRSLVLDVAATFVQTLPLSRRSKIRFKNDRPGMKWLRGFLNRYPQLKVKTTAQLENERSEAMSPDIVAEHFARIRTLMDSYGIHDPTHVFNLDECGFSVKGMSWGRRVKRVAVEGTTVFQRTIAWQGSVDHVTCMAVVNAAGQIFTPAFVLPGVMARFRRREGGRWETPADFLPQPNILFMREVAGIDSDLFYAWANNFIEETASIRQGGKKILLVYDGYASHCSYRVLKLFRENDIVVASLPAHTSHALQPLDVGVFSPLKLAFRNHLNRRVVVSNRRSRNDIFTLCELLKNAFHEGVTASNIIGGFRGSGLWCDEKRGPDQSRISPTSYTAPASPSSAQMLGPETRAQEQRRQIVDESTQRVDTAKKLYALYLSKASELLSDGTVVENGLVRVSTTRGAILTSDSVIQAAKNAAARKARAIQEKAEKSAQRERRRIERAVEAARKAEDAEKREETALLRMKDRRHRVRAMLKTTRAARREARRTAAGN